MGIDTEGNLYGWGYDDSKQLFGEGVATSSTPTLIKEGTKFSEISIGYSSGYALAIDKSGNIWSWGDNDRYQLGNGTTTNSSTPSKITSGTVFKQVRAGTSTSVAIDTSGNLWAWGYVYKGDGTSPVNITTPTKIMSGTTFSKVVVSARDTIMAIDTSGNIWTWGQNVSGQLGNGSTSSWSMTAAIIASGTTFKDIECNSLLEWWTRIRRQDVIEVFRVEV